ncbi:2-oxoisovalerate dehydrogenase E1 component alpha subunit [Microbacteriaceae bacterium SG_E_30_P1]|uniref:2-oxoisovalerate dehydrogenase subunit alpha n=1 Tax=Antiquaquibacter oligotrophicus TaxID=2880260 RepID=A0ABT6KQZ9_9MICO|nr:thiamine pyrophosphate-dependent dehydrogenase E1 component subunit alpha [Antiquaquibacter oligotrophicus]MDH6182398.1 2-oxoisovalerate dehydrogenase E1 component alpha subunit [Antiquaquibacter oligotrophicus]UDF14629.1 thiamine pyrophosphate-dependent dehydrogenase E1 component subunit alpha [Antiquaquibacter oligotrophicus]
MAYTPATIQLLSAEGTIVKNDVTEQYLPLIEQLSDEQLQNFYRQMAVIRRFDVEAGNLQRQGQLALWIPSIGQEGAQVGSGYAARAQDHIFPAYREHVVARIRGVDPMRIIELLRGLSHGGWDPKDHGNFHLYTLVIGSQSLHATGYAMGIQFDGATATGDPEKDEAVVVYFGDGASSQGDVSEALVFAASYQTPQVFFLQNNRWAISVPVERQSRSPLYLRSSGFGIPGYQVDGNDVLASYAVTRASLDAARAGEGPRFIEALTYRIGAHTTSDDPTKYRDEKELEFWVANDPISRYELYLRSRGEGEAFFADVAQEGEDLAADARRRTTELGTPGNAKIFENVYSDPHPVMDAQSRWLEQYEASFEEGGE